ncbi:MAG: SusD/RagB family nutrient-binding outer membrane lipoprotein [Firmicutes bacterium]|nr:SusD/RagB family nutrient-binding outer membrane lipoprotein [Bacillota bacterium]MCM1400743.1 SusD/RagB family nutrient-binding outer membrane lipoprotein [Bacteroides sp.]MCM1476838.1 SusD/RagB family nutrient-binding outer membrane lipoprotein [Bacteroides sp.]
MKHIFYNILAGGALAVAAVGCTGDYEEINANQFQPGNLDADDYALVSAMTNICGAVVPADVNCNQFTDCLLGGPLGGYFADGANFTTSFVRNNAPDNWTSVFLKDSKIISTLYTNISLVETACENSGEITPMAVANIIKVACMDRVTDCYGPIPYSGIGEDGAVKTPYDSQEAVYNKFFEELADARTTLLNNLESQISPLADKVYAGDLSKWVKFCNSLQLRLAMRLSYVNPTLAKQKAEDAVNPANGGVIESNEDNATWKNYVNGGNPMRTAIMYNAQDSRPAADIICYMNGYNDPRREVYFTKANWLDDDKNIMKDPAGNPIEYVGIRRGWNTFSTEWSVNFSGINVLGTDPLLWQNASEVAFLRAEGVAVFGWNMGGTAEEFYNKGIRLSFEDNGKADDVDKYLADNKSVPATYYDPSGINPWNGTLPQVTIKWDESATTEQKQERIIVQKWIANFTLGNEAWADLRRTGYPKLIPVAFNGSNVVDINKGPQRQPYPSAEYTDNLVNVQKAVSEYLNGPDNLATKLWWAAKPGI